MATIVLPTLTAQALRLRSRLDDVDPRSHVSNQPVAPNALRSCARWSARMKIRARMSEFAHKQRRPSVTRDGAPTNRSLAGPRRTVRSTARTPMATGRATKGSVAFRAIATTGSEPDPRVCRRCDRIGSAGCVTIPRSPWLSDADQRWRRSHVSPLIKGRL